MEAERYARSFALGGAKGIITVERAQKGHALEARIATIGSTKGALPIRAIAARLRRLFDLDAEPSAIAAALSRDPLIGPRLAARPGLRVPGGFDGFELAIRAILGQQISVKGATTIAGRIAAKFGEKIAERETEGMSRP